MSQGGAYWRQSAVLVLATRSLVNGSAQSLVRRPSRKSLDAGLSPANEEASMSRSGPKAVPDSNANESFNLLMVKRTEGSSFMPNAFVFPGGMLDPSDHDVRWNAIFEKVTGQSLSDIAKELAIPGERPPIMSDKGAKFGLPLEIAFRLCAIRETFEEAGILLFTRAPSPHYGPSTTGSGQKINHLAALNEAVLRSWRDKVSSDASAFQSLCEELHVVPNVWALYEWSNWLTPVRQKVKAPPVKPKRFDTIFYVCCIDHQPDTEADSKETTVAEWHTAEDWIGPSLKGDRKLAPPHRIELASLSNFRAIHQLAEFVHQREPLGLRRRFPEVVVCADDVLTVMEGDELYPDNPDFNGTETMLSTNSTAAELIARPGAKNRMLLSKGLVQMNVSLPCGMPSPDSTLLNESALKQKL